jgi:glycosyltransferase involved in cell wall biosynthesis
MSRLRILLVGYLPPPWFGPSVTYRALMHSEFPRRVDVTFLNISVAESISDLESVRPGKLVLMAKFLLVEAWYLLTRRFDFVCCPISVNRNAFLKDALLLGLARLFRVPTVLYAHGNNIPDFHDRSSPRIRRWIERTIQGVAGAIVLGESLRFNFDRWLPPEKILVVPTGIEPQAAVPSAGKNPAVITVAYLGNLVGVKGAFVTLEAAAVLAARHRPDIRFEFGGPWFLEHEERAAREFVAKNGLEKSVAFLGPLTNEAKWTLLSGADMLVFPTFYYNETMGLVLLEAMQAGLPVIATRRGSIPEIIQDGVNGFLVEEQNAADLADKILRLADDAALRERMGQTNQQRFAEYYTHEQYGKRMIAVFETLARQRGGQTKGFAHV